MVAQAQWPSRQQAIDFKVVFRLFDQLDTHLFLPQFDLPEVVSPHIAATWTTDWWDFAQQGSQLRIYFDGSFTKTPEESDCCAGTAIAAFLLTSEGWMFAGALSSSLPQMHSSYTAELAGALVAHKFAYDLLKIHLASTGALPEVTFCFDALTIGHQAQGDWSSISHPLFGKSLRDLTLFIEQRFALQLQYQHIRGHTGELGNELVDELANAARRHGGLTPFATWIDDMIQPAVVDCMNWLWILFAPEFAGCWDEGCLSLPGPSTEPDATVVPTALSNTHQDEECGMIHVQLRLASCNVLSLKGGRDSTSTLAGISREQALLQQLEEERITIFALQETRLRKLHQTQHPDFFILKAAATDAGHGGVLIGVSRKLPYGRTRSTCSTTAKPVYFHDSHLKIVAFDPRYLIVRVATPHLRCLLVAAHAPHTGHELGVIETWWESLYDAIPSSLRTWPTILLCDANAAVGAHTSCHIGDFHAAKEDPKAEPFESYLSRSDLWLPSTFEAHQKGPGATWTHSSGSLRRIDYIGLPIHWQYDHCQAWVSDVIDPTILRADHSAVCADLAFALTQPRDGFTADKTGGAHLELDPNVVHWEGLNPFCHHDLDVHSHFQILQDNLIQHLQPQQKKRRRQPHKTTMSHTTWELVCVKRKWRSTLAEQTGLQQKTLLEACFAAWKYQRDDLGSSYGELLALQDRLIAQALAQFRHFGLMVTRSMRRDDRAFFESLLTDGADLLEPQVKQLWAVIRRSLPKFRNRKVGYSPYKLAHLEDQSARHFEELEMGTQVAAEDLINSCNSAQICAAQRDLPSQISFTSLPSLTEVEDALRATRADRATGFDAVPSNVYHKHAAFLGRYFYNVVLKIFVWGTEPIQGKGGFLKMIPKRLGAVEAKHFRGILLLPTLAKRVHAIARARLMQQAGRQRDPAQLGGYAGQQVAFGAQTLRALTNIFSAKGLSSAVLYVDLATAFHHLIRQLVTGLGSPTEWNDVLQRLSAANTPVAAGQDGDQLIGILERLHIDPLLTRLLRDVHENTWYSLSGTDLVQTLRGTRPGSPLADAIFHLLMTEVASDLREWLGQQPEVMRSYQQIGIDPVFIIWSDDFAIPIATKEAVNLVEEVVKLTQHIQKLFTARGFLVNFDVGKTSAVLTFVGPQAPEMRRQHLLCDRPGIAVRLPNDQEVWLHFSMKYKHLGAMFSSSHSFEPELRQRLGTAKATFQTLYRPILGNRHFPLHLRLRFFQTLVCSKLFFGMGAWATPTIQQMGRLRTTFNAMLRKMCRTRPEEHVSNGQLLCFTGSVDVRVRIAIDRLLYAKRLFQVGPDYLQQLAHLEKEHCGEAAWIRGLQADLVWLQQVLPHELPAGDFVDLTHMIEFWQEGAPRWKGMLKRATRRHRLQEELMHDAQTFHRRILQTLREGGATFSPDEGQTYEEDRRELHTCHCGRTFTSSQGLALHKRRQHGIHAPEFAFTTGATCPACLRFYWTSNRLAMHLAYIPRGGGVNECFAALSKANFSGGFQAQDAPPAHANVVRLDAIQMAGPLPLLEDHCCRQVEEAVQRIAEIEAEVMNYEQPEDHCTLGLQLGDALTIFTSKWAQRCRERGLAEVPDVMDRWIQLLSVHGNQFDEWAAHIFQQWGEHMLPDIIAELLDGELEYVLDLQFAEAVELFPRTERLRQLALWRTRLQQTQQELREPDVPHRPVRKGTANGRERGDTMHKIPALFHAQGQWQEAFRAIQWDEIPSVDKIPSIAALDDGTGLPCFLVVHLFSGRRRVSDLHWQLQQLAPRLGVQFVILSMDTAISPWYGDLWHTSTSWRMLEKCYDAAIVALTMVGSPCETFSEARYTPPPPGDVSRWPRPLRSTENFFGLPDITNKELKQAQTGTNFFLQGLQALGSHIVRGGLFLSEHPGMPTDPDRPTTWRAPLTQLLRKHPDVHLSHIQQWRWGAEAVKPTGLLAHRLPKLLASLYACSVPDAQRPTTAAIGKSPEGEFRTAKLKEYPTALSAAFAKAFGDQLRTDLRMPWDQIHEGQSLRGWIREAAEAGSEIRANAEALPDYQPR